MDEQRGLQITQRAFEDEGTIQFASTVPQLWVAISMVQLALHHPDLPPTLIKVGTQWVNASIAALGRADAEYAEVLNLGMMEQFDVTEDGNPAIELNHAWTVMLPEDDALDPIVTLGRPQDWGDPTWTLREYFFACTIDGTRYQQTSYIWFNTSEDADLLFLEIGKQVACDIFYPSVPAQLCGDQFLAPEDVWDEEWGERPEVVAMNFD